MLPLYIIEELRRREEALREEEGRPQPRLEIDIPSARRPRPETPVEDRGVVIIEVF